MSEQDRVERVAGRFAARKNARLRDDTPDALVPESATDERIPDAPDPEKNTTWVLSPEQRAILYRMIGRYWDIAKIQAALRDEYVDFPELTDRALRYHRQRITKEARTEYKRALAAGVKIGLSNIEGRITILEGLIYEWLKRPLSRESSAEIREASKLIMVEVNGGKGGDGSAADSIPANVPPDVRKRLAERQYAMVKDNLEELITQQADTRLAMREAREAAGPAVQPARAERPA